MKNYSNEEMRKFREEYRRRRTIRITITFFTLLLLILVVIFTFPEWRLFGLNKLIWAPFFYVIVFGLLVASIIVYKCPACNSQMGSGFNTKFCPKCGINLDND